jgi:hypothetical protein
MYVCMYGMDHYYTYVIKNSSHTKCISLSIIILHSAPHIKLWGEANYEILGRNSIPKNFRMLTQSFYLFRMSQRATNSSSSQRYKEKLLALENDPDVDMFVTQKRSSTSQVPSNQKKAKAKPTGLKRAPFWFGYQAMNWTNRGKGLPMDTHTSVATLVKNGMREKEAKECQSAISSFPFVVQEEWPNSREDGKEGQHFNLTQIPSDVEVDKFGFAFDYQIAILFELGKTEWEKYTVMILVETRLKEMNIELGDVIGEPIALMCYHKSTKWSGVIKLHLKTPEIDGVGLLQGLRSFILKLDEDKLKRGKVCKTYDALALNNLLSVKITSETLEFKEWYELFEKIVEESFHRGTEYEITNVQKKKKNVFAWVVASSPEQAQRMKKHQITFNHEVLEGKLADRSHASKDDIARKNALILIAKNLNKAKSIEEIEKNIESHMGPKNAVNFFFKKDDKTANISGHVTSSASMQWCTKPFPRKQQNFLENMLSSPHILEALMEPTLQTQLNLLG